MTAARIEAFAACVTAAVALTALIGVKFKLDETDRLQATAAARAAYRGHLALAVAHPTFADPVDSCALAKSDDGGAYAAFVDHLIYSAELMLAVDDSWNDVFIQNLAPHAGYVCSAWSPIGSPPELRALLTQYMQSACNVQTVCD